MIRDWSIKTKLRAVMLVTASAVLGLTAVAFISYELLTFRNELIRNVSMLAAVIAANSTASLAFRNEQDAQETMRALQAEPQIVAASLYDKDQRLFASYPSHRPEHALLREIGGEGYRFKDGYLLFSQPVFQANKRQGTLFLKADLTAMYQRFRLYLGIVALVLAFALLLALALSNAFQKELSEPILALAATARTVSRSKQYSIQARKFSADEIGQLTDAFNDMMVQIHARDTALRDQEESLHLALTAAQMGTWSWEPRSDQLHWDDTQHQMFGLKPGAFGGSQQHFIDLVVPDDRERVSQAYTRAIEQKSDLGLEFCVYWPDGSIHYLVSRGKALFDAQGEITRVTGVTMDISQSKIKENKIQAALAEKDILLSEIHHRVKNNLQIVDSLINLQSSQVDDPQVLGMLRDSQNCIRSMALIHQTLYQSNDLSRVDFSAVLSSLVPILVSSYGVDPKRITLSIEAPKILLPLNIAMPCGLVVNELIVNAIKHAFPQERSGEIRIECKSNAEGCVTLAVSDDGVGIPEGLVIEHTATLGLQLITLLAEQISANLCFRRANPTRVALRFSLPK